MFLNFLQWKLKIMNESSSDLADGDDDLIVPPLHDAEGLTD